MEFMRVHGSSPTNRQILIYMVGSVQVGNEWKKGASVSM